MTARFDMAGLIDTVRSWSAGRDTPLADLHALDEPTLANRFAPGDPSRPEMVLGDDVALELGHPSTASRAIVLTTTELDRVRHGRVSVVGPDIDEAGEHDRWPFAQVVVLGVEDGSPPDPFAIENAQYLEGKLRGYVVRSVPGRLWARVSRRAREEGMSLATVGSALVADYGARFPNVARVEVMFATSTDDDVEALAPIAAHARLLSGQHKRLVLTGDNEAECLSLDCENCDEREFCDSLRDIVIQRRTLR